MTKIEQGKRWNEYLVMNLINDKYNLTQTEITNLQEADEYYSQHLAPSYYTDPNRIDEVDVQIFLEIMNNWGDKVMIAARVGPLLAKSTIKEEIGK